MSTITKQGHFNITKNTDMFFTCAIKIMDIPFSNKNDINLSMDEIEPTG